MKYIYDELHGYIPLNDFEREVIDTPTFQRLRRIKQLAQAWFVYPGAVHTRFSHSIGVKHLMDRVASKLLVEGFLKSDDLQLLKIAALLHDVGHTPYSHAIETFFRVNFGLRHEELSAWVIIEDPYISNVLSRHGIDPYEVAAVVRGRHKVRSYDLLMSSDMDVDRLDYLLRDALHTGVKYGIIDLERIVQTLVLDTDGYIAVPYKAVQAAESFYIARLHMYRSVYYHKTIASYQLLIQEIYRLMIKDKETRELLKPFTDPQSIKKAIRDGLLYLWDDFFVGGLMNVAINKGIGSEGLRELIRLYLRRESYKVMYEWVGFGNESPLNKDVLEGLRELVTSLREEKGAEGCVKLYVEVIPIISKDVEVRVLTDSGSLRIDMYDGSIIKNLPEAMGIIRLYTLPLCEQRVKDLIPKFLKHKVSI